MTPQPFSLEIAQMYARETVLEISRCKMDKGARKREICDLAKVMAQAYRMRKVQDWKAVA